MIVDDHDIVSVIQLNKMLLINDVEEHLYSDIKSKVDIEEVTAFYQLANIYSLTNLAKKTITYLERCFTMTVETKNFLELSFTVVAKLLSRSTLDITSELEIFKAGNRWVGFKGKERSKFAKDLLMKVRLPLLSEHALKYILSCFPSTSEKHECVSLLEKFLHDKGKFFHNKSSVYYTHRYCTQTNFNLLICGGFNYHPNSRQTSKNVTLIDGRNFKSLTKFAPMTEERQAFKAVCVKGEVFVFGSQDPNDYTGDELFSIEKYSPTTNVWTKVADLRDERIEFSICAFMDKIFLVGGIITNDVIIDSCFEFDTKNCGKESLV